jgi:hypothetical protein
MISFIVKKVKKKNILPTMQSCQNKDESKTNLRMIKCVESFEQN